jgi:hypothetical protein
MIFKDLIKNEILKILLENIEENLTTFFLNIFRDLNQFSR